MKVSVIIPAYNAMRYLPETVDSVMNQTFKDFEIIIVNDGSTDHIETWVTSFEDQRVTLITQPNQGASKARNTGIEHAQGEYLAFLDADDIWYPQKLQKQVNMIEGKPRVGVIYTWISSIDQHGQARGQIRKNVAEGNVWATLIKHNIVECGSTPLIRRECFEKIGLFDESLSNIEDRDMWLRIACDYEFRVIKEPLVGYRQHSEGKSKNWDGSERSVLKLLEKAFQNPPKSIQASNITALSRQSHAIAYVRLAWKPLQSVARDWETALTFRRQAVQFWPIIQLDPSYIRLTIAIYLTRLLGGNGYDSARRLFYSVRNGLGVVFRHKS